MPLPDIAPLVRRLTPADAGEVMTLQRAAWVQEAHANQRLDIPPLHETLAEVTRDLADPAYTAWGVRQAGSGRLLAITRTSALDDGRTAFVGRVGVVPDRQGEGLGAAVLAWAEAQVPADLTRFALVTGAASVGNHAFYARQGYRPTSEVLGPDGTVTLAKERAVSRST